VTVAAVLRRLTAPWAARPGAAPAVSGVRYTTPLSHLGRNAATGWLAEIANATSVNPTPADYDRAFATVQTLGDQRVSLVDAIVAALATRLGLEVWTYDHHSDVIRARV
jgi:hypothetical protein